MRAATDLAKARGLARHLDGARLFKAAVAQVMQPTQKNTSNQAVALLYKAQGAMNFDEFGTKGANGVSAAGMACDAGGGIAPPSLEAIVAEARRIVQCFDGVSVCLSKGWYRLRFVTHLDVDSAGIEHAVAVMRAFFR